MKIESSVVKRGIFYSIEVKFGQGSSLQGGSFRFRPAW